MGCLGSQACICGPSDTHSWHCPARIRAEVAKALRDAYQKGHDDEFDANEETRELNV